VEITIEAFNAIQSSRKSKINDIVTKIVSSVKASKAGAEITARELYNKETAHYYNLSLALRASKDFNDVCKDFKFVMSDKVHANFTKLACLKK